MNSGLFLNNAKQLNYGNIKICYRSLLPEIAATFQGPLLLTWLNFNLAIDK